MRNAFTALLLILAAALAMPVQSAEPVEVTASDGSANDRFGAAMASDGRYVVISAARANVDGRHEQGAVYVFERADCTLREIAKLVAADGESGQHFGESLAIADNVILVGATGATGAQAEHGAVYVFTREQDAWVQTDKLFAANGFAGMRLGTSVALDGRTIMAGAPRTNGSGSEGSVHVFERQRGDWSEVDILRADDDGFVDSFGASLAMRRDMALVGSPDRLGASGGFYQFQRERNDDWEQEERWRSRRVAARLGAAMASSGDYLAVSAPGGESRDTFMSGAVFIYEVDDDDIEDETVLTASDWGTGDAFGSAVAMDGNRLLAAAGNAGKVYLFQRDDDWRETEILRAPAGNEQYGAALAAFGDLVVVGAPAAGRGGNENQGVAYVYETGN